MKKILSVKLVFSQAQTEDKGRIYQVQEWDIPFESLVPDEKSKLEDHMLLVVKDKFPEPHWAGIAHMLYDGMSSGGELICGDYRLTIRFERAN